MSPSGLSGGDTFERASQEWLDRLDRLVSAGQRSPGTPQMYRYHLGKNVLPALGSLRLVEIDTPLVEAVILDLHERIGAATARTCRTIIPASCAWR